MKLNWISLRNFIIAQNMFFFYTRGIETKFERIWHDPKLNWSLVFRWYWKKDLFAKFSSKPLLGKDSEYSNLKKKNYRKIGSFQKIIWESGVSNKFPDKSSILRWSNFEKASLWIRWIWLLERSRICKFIKKLKTLSFIPSR